MKKLVLLASLFLATTATAQIANNTITAAGSAEVQLEPTVAVYSMSVNTSGATVKEAQSANAIQSMKVLKALNKQFSIQKKDLKNSLQINKDYKYKDGQNVDNGYVARNTISVRVFDLNRLGEIMDVTGSLGAEVGHVSYGLIDAQAAKSQALNLASRNAKVNAEALLAPFGKTVGDLVAVVQSEAQSVARNYERSAPAGMSAEAGGGISTTVNVGQITVSASVVVIFSIK